MTFRISETHWNQAGQKRLDLRGVLLYSRYEEESAPHTQGVVLMQFKQALVGEALKGVELSCSWTASSMNKEDLMQM